MFQWPSPTRGWNEQDVSALDVVGLYDIFMERAEFPPETASNHELVTRVENASTGLLGSVMKVTGERSLLLTNRGWFGIGPRETTVNDIVIVVPGLQMPIILRKRPDGGNYQLVGVAYVHGIMKGEFIDSILWDPDSECKTYVID